MADHGLNCQDRACVCHAVQKVRHVEAEAADDYARMIGYDLPDEERHARIRRLAAGADERRQTPGTLDHLADLRARLHCAEHDRPMARCLELGSTHVIPAAQSDCSRKDADD